ncbi:unnamed protein product [marine sediment metagenome]|uniref:Uncharacterized protein n=1 Tax=marine sediment metagenome TaxID=412755 RepID=X1JDS0_9ZZZZ
MDKAYMYAVAVEIIGIVVTSGGIIFEYYSGETIGLVVITIGSVIIATGSLFYAKVYRQLGKLNVGKKNKKE